MDDTLSELQWIINTEYRYSSYHDIRVTHKPDGYYVIGEDTLGDECEYYLDDGFHLSKVKLIDFIDWLNCFLESYLAFTDFEDCNSED